MSLYNRDGALFAECLNMQYEARFDVIGTIQKKETHKKRVKHKLLI